MEGKTSKAKVSYTNAYSEMAFRSGKRYRGGFLHFLSTKAQKRPKNDGFQMEGITLPVCYQSFIAAAF